MYVGVELVSKIKEFIFPNSAILHFSIYTKMVNNFLATET